MNMWSLLFPLLPLLFSSVWTVSNATATKTGNLIPTAGSRSSSSSSASTSSRLPSSPSTSPSTAAFQTESANFRDALRFKLKLVNDAMKYGGGGSTTSYASTSNLATTESSGAADLEEALALSSAELGASNEVAVEDAMRSILGIDTSLSSSSSGSSSTSTSPQPIGPGNRQFQFHRGIKHDDGSRDHRRIKAAVHTKHTFEFKPVKIDQLQEQPEPRIIEVEARSLPLEIHFKSASSRIKMVQQHQKGELRQVERTQSEEEPQRLIHLVRKPIIQEVREIITPYRRIVQEIQPVMEEIHTVIAHSGQQHRHDDEQKHETTSTSSTVSNIRSGSASGFLEVDESTGSSLNSATSGQLNKFERQMLKPSASGTSGGSSSTASSSHSQLMNNLENFVRNTHSGTQSSSPLSTHRKPVTTAVTVSASHRTSGQIQQQNGDSFYEQKSEFEPMRHYGSGTATDFEAIQQQHMQITPARLQQQQFQRRTYGPGKDFFQTSASNNRNYYHQQGHSLGPHQNNNYNNNQHYNNNNYNQRSNWNPYY